MRANRLANLLSLTFAIFTIIFTIKGWYVQAQSCSDPDCTYARNTANCVLNGFTYSCNEGLVAGQVSCAIAGCHANGASCLKTTIYGQQCQINTGTFPQTCTVTNNNIISTASCGSGSTCTSAVGIGQSCGGAVCCSGSNTVCSTNGCSGGSNVCLNNGCANAGQNGCQFTNGCCAGLVDIGFGTCGTPTCTPGAWTNGACGAGGCAANQRLQTRTYSPSGCQANDTQCVADATCSGSAVTCPGGTGCNADGSTYPVTGSPGQTVCGTNSHNWQCQNDGAWHDQGTACACGPTPTPGGGGGGVTPTTGVCGNPGGFCSAGYPCCSGSCIGGTCSGGGGGCTNPTPLQPSTWTPNGNVAQGTYNFTWTLPPGAIATSIIIDDNGDNCLDLFGRPTASCPAGTTWKTDHQKDEISSSTTSYNYSIVNGHSYKVTLTASGTAPTCSYYLSNSFVITGTAATPTPACTQQDPGKPTINSVTDPVTGTQNSTTSDHVNITYTDPPLPVGWGTFCPLNTNKVRLQIANNSFTINGVFPPANVVSSSSYNDTNPNFSLNSLNGGGSSLTTNGTYYAQLCASNNNGASYPNAGCSAPKQFTKTAVAATAPYFKLKNASYYHRTGNLTSTFPSGYAAFDSSDYITGGYFNTGAASGDQGVGVVMMNGPLSVGASGATNQGVSNKGWRSTNYSYTPSFTPSEFLSYVKSRKTYTNAGVNGAGTVNVGSGGGIYIIDGSTSTPTISNVTGAGSNPVILIVTGSVNIQGAPGTVFNPGAQPIAIIATDTISFDNALTEADGLFVADNINLTTAGTSSTGLKIVGNLVSTGTNIDTTARDLGAGATKPSFFMVFDPSYYVNLLGNLSVTKYDWKQLQ